MTETVFLVNPAAANGSTGRRWPEIAHQAAGVGLEGDALLSERRGHLGELAREAALDGARLLVVVGGDGSVNEVVNGLAGIENPPAVALIPRGTGGDFVRTFGIPTTSRRRRGWRSTGDDAGDRPRPGQLPGWDGSDGVRALRQRRERRHERRDRATRQRHLEGARRQGVVPLGHVRRLRRLVRRRDAADGRRRDPQRADVRRRRRERPLLRRRDEDVPRRAPRRRPPRRGHDRRRDEARPRPDDAEDLPGHPPAAPEGGGAPGPRGHGRDRRARPGRARRRAARHDPGAVRGAARARCGCGCLRAAR